MVRNRKDVYETAWCVLQTLHSHGPLNANQILNKTNGISKQTMYDSFPILFDEELISRDKNKIISLNHAKFDQQSQLIQIYDEFQFVGDNLDSMFSKLEKKLKKHTPVLDPMLQKDKDLTREILTKPPYFDLMTTIVRFFELGSLMDFFLNADFFTKTIEKRAMSVRRKNARVVSRFLNLIKNAEPVLWGEMIMLVQTRLSSKITPT